MELQEFYKKELTETDKKILYGMTAGYTNSQLAEIVGYSERTIRRKIKDLCEFFNANNRNSLIREASVAIARKLF